MLQCLWRLLTKVFQEERLYPLEFTLAGSSFFSQHLNSFPRDVREDLIKTLAPYYKVCRLGDDATCYVFTCF